MGVVFEPCHQSITRSHLNIQNHQSPKAHDTQPYTNLISCKNIPYRVCKVVPTKQKTQCRPHWNIWGKEQTCWEVQRAKSKNYQIPRGNKMIAMTRSGGRGDLPIKSRGTSHVLKRTVIKATDLKAHWLSMWN